jgi:C4-dicarboxylate-specific signal transduction histidine kinase
VLRQRTRELEQVEAELRILNENLEHKVIENTQKYLELTQAYHVQEKLAAIGEIAADIAHDLNTPISTVATGAELLQQILLELLSKQLDKLTPKEIRNALDLAQNHLREKFISGIQLEKEKQTILEILSTITPLQQSHYNILAEQFARCRILNPEIIRQLVQQPNISAVITLTENIQTAMNLMDTINHSASRSASVIQNLREYITKTDQVEKKSVNLFQSITSALNIFSNSLDRKATIRTEIPSNIYISGNEIKLFQLWSNLIKNALEAVRETRQPELKITAKTEAEQVFVYFENNGPAIPEGSITEIFSRFYTTKSAQSGSGLGLTIVQTVVKEHGGTIGIQSDEKATVFKIQLPLKALGS